MLRQELASYSVVLTTYHSMTHESPTRCVVAARQAGKRGRDGEEQVVRRPGGDLFAIRWHRLVLDEGQCIKNAKTLTAHAACALRARCRWCLSGTPIQNSINDLFSYFKFLVGAIGGDVSMRGREGWEAAPGMHPSSDSVVCREGTCLAWATNCRARRARRARLPPMMLSGPGQH